MKEQKPKKVHAVNLSGLFIFCVLVVGALAAMSPYFWPALRTVIYVWPHRYYEWSQGKVDGSFQDIGVFALATGGIFFCVWVVFSIIVECMEEERKKKERYSR